MKKKILITILSLILVGTLVYGEENIHIYKGRILEVGDLEKLSGEGVFIGYTQKVLLEFLSGPYKGQKVETENNLSDSPAYDIVLEKNDRVTVVVMGDLESVSVSGHLRQDYLLGLAIGFSVLVLLIGGKKGFKAILSLGITVLGVLYIMLPLLLKGYNPIGLSIIISAGVTVITIFLVSGVNKKSLSSILGTIFGVVVAGLIAYYIGVKTKITGMNAEDATMLMYIPQNVEFNFQHLLFSGIILGSLGAVMDVGMSISSSIEEIYKANPSLTGKDLFQGGMNVGKDVMGTMINTLVLAYVGSSLPLLLLFIAYEAPMIDIINLDIISTEILRSLAGSVGLVLTIPITALISSSLIKKSKE